MSLFGRQARTSWPPQILVPARGGGNSGGIVPVTVESAKSHSAVWAALRLRADLVSTMPVGVFREVDGINVQMATPLVLRQPGGERCDIHEWLYSSQVDLDSVGNAVGIITKVDGYGLPACIELQDRSTVTIRVRDRKLIGYRIAGKMYDPSQVWHEKQHTGSGLHVGLSPIAYAAMAISLHLSAEQFALRWFGGGEVPTARFKNVARTVSPSEAATVKNQLKQAAANRDVLVHGADWDYEMVKAETASTEFIQTRRISVLEVCRFFGVPSDMIDGESETKGSIKYTNITQRLLELLILNFQPALTRRETRLSTLLPAARSVVFDTQYLLRMDPAVLASMQLTQINSRTLTPDEARATANRPPLTQAQVDQFTELFGTATATPGTLALSGAEPPA